MFPTSRAKSSGIDDEALDEVRFSETRLDEVCEVRSIMEDEGACSPYDWHSFIIHLLAYERGSKVEDFLGVILVAVVDAAVVDAHESISPPVGVVLKGSNI